MYLEHLLILHGYTQVSTTTMHQSAITNLWKQKWYATSLHTSSSSMNFDAEELAAASLAIRKGDTIPVCNTNQHMYSS